MIDISVIIVNWNTRKLLLDCVESLYRTTRNSSLEIIVVDNASTDGSVDAIIKEFPEVVIIANPDNFGFAKANNIGIQRAQGHYVCLVNSDVIALEGVLDKMHFYMEAFSEIGALAPKILTADGRIQKICREFPSLRNVFCQEFFLDVLVPDVTAFRGREMIHCDYETVIEVPALSGCFLMVRRDVIDQIGLLDERFFFYSEDVDWCRRMHDAGWKRVHYPRAAAIHFGRGSSSSATTRFQLEMLKAQWQYWKKHKSILQCTLFWLIKLTGTLGRAVSWFAVSFIAPQRRPMARMSATAYLKMLAWLIDPTLKKATI